jgi:hypothetical protein
MIGDRTPIGVPGMARLSLIILMCPGLGIIMRLITDGLSILTIFTGLDLDITTADFIRRNLL